MSALEEGDFDEFGGNNEFDGNEEIDEDVLLGTDENPTESETLNTSQECEDEEQLDYDEDEEEEKKPRDKFESERKPTTTISQAPKPDVSVKTEVKVDETGDSKVVESKPVPSTPPVKNGSVKCYVNPKFKGRLPFNVGPRPLTTLPPPPVFHVPPTNIHAPPFIPMQRAPAPIMRPLLPVAPGQTVVSQFVPPVPTSGPVAQVVQDHDGTIRFRAMIPPPTQPKVTIARAGHCDPGPKSNWDSNVEDFLKRTQASKRRRSRSSSRSSYSSRSRSSSYSSYSRSSRSPSKSRSRSPIRSRSKSAGQRSRRRPSPKRSHRRDTRRYRRDSREKDREPYRPRNDRTRPKRDERKTQEEKNTIECAEALGLDQEYVKKLEEQKKLREEMARKKYRRDERDTKNETKVVVEVDRPKRKPSTPDQKLKPYLAVVIHNLTNLSDAYKRVKMIANAVGPTKKVWQTSDDSISVIFESHENAKKFMLQYHMKPFNGITLDIGLEKVFLNLNAIP
ncbi:unnamed protein product [Bursaphelenchus xylophilus]|uniref:(pine wood nematode) hypothetical protein n=1 Tax=Bursaphelenchus xylophilus TaxID=6326 RepID=A0A1I7SDN3_BURXY|nr:unnamed protein product [Bursaphelenchus xylophilus]CAG9120914.1 unnamed protein product [Bursaphelenchus xylophilus]